MLNFRSEFVQLITLNIFHSVLLDVSMGVNNFSVDLSWNNWCSNVLGSNLLGSFLINMNVHIDIVLLGDGDMDFIVSFRKIFDLMV